MNEIGRLAVFLDRDGVLNRAVVRGGKPYPPAGLHELELLPGVPEALRRLKGAGFLLIGVTNQPDVARGQQRREIVEAINGWLSRRLPLDDLLVCYHDDADRCQCRKPSPGLLLEAADRHGIELAASWMVGDRWRDVEAGRRAGCSTVLLEGVHEEPDHGVRPDYRAKSLEQAATRILDRTSDGGDMR